LGEGEGEKNLSKMIIVTKYRLRGTAQISMTLPQFKQNCGMHLLSFNQRTSYTAPNHGIITGLAIMSLDDYLEGQQSREGKNPWCREINSF
jgi:hypothetical protein